MTTVSIYEQDLFGTIHWRVMRDDGRLIFDRHQTDFESEGDALAAIKGEFRRKQLGEVEIAIHRRRIESTPVPSSTPAEDKQKRDLARVRPLCHPARGSLILGGIVGLSRVIRFAS